MNQSIEISKETPKPTEETEEVKTLFVSGLPLNVREREIYLLFQQCKGYDSSIIKLKGKSAVAFVLFDSTQAASEAKEKINVKKTKNS
jgi:RNA recognition motif-containing protein